MKRLTLALLAALMLTAGNTASVQAAKATGDKNFSIGDKTFLLNGKPFVVKAAELHYPRIPREYWDHRI